MDFSRAEIRMFMEEDVWSPFWLRKGMSLSESESESYFALMEKLEQQKKKAPAHGMHGTQTHTHGIVCATAVLWKNFGQT